MAFKVDEIHRWWQTWKLRAITAIVLALVFIILVYGLIVISREHLDTIWLVADIIAIVIFVPVAIFAFDMAFFEHT
jgi:uncharacterized membrane protein